MQLKAAKMVDNRGKHLKRFHFEKGRSGNPAGGKKGPRGPQLKKRLAEFLVKEIKLENDVVLTGADVIISKLFELAKASDMRAITMIFQYMEGMPVRAVKQEDEKEPITFNINIGKAGVGSQGQQQKSGK